MKTMKDEFLRMATDLRHNDHPGTDLREDMIKSLEQAAQNVREIPDNWTYRIVILGVIVTVLTALILAAMEEEMRSALIPVATMALGGLLGILAPSPSAG